MQFYPQCWQITITGGTGKTVPEGVPIPGAYSEDDPGIVFGTAREDITTYVSGKFSDFSAGLGVANVRYSLSLDLKFLSSERTTGWSRDTSGWKKDGEWSLEACASGGFSAQWLIRSGIWKDVNEFGRLS